MEAKVSQRTYMNQIATDAIDHDLIARFTLRDIEGFSTQETAEILGISAQSVKTRLHRARLFLREKISATYREGVVQ